MKYIYQYIIHINTYYTAVSIEEPLFQAFPNEIVFSKYEPYGTYTQKLYLRNIDAVPRRVKVFSPDSPYFSISAPIQSEGVRKIGDGKIASGMEVYYIITFKPQERMEYNFNLIVATEREKFIIPLSAAGLRGVIDFPDEIQFKTVPVKYESSNTIMVRNVGNGPTTINLTAQPPFGVSIDKSFLNPGDQTQVTVTFLPEESIKYENELIVEYDNGAKSYIKLSGIAENVAVHLSRHMLHMDSTYISLTSSQTFKIFNRSDVSVSFDWKSFASLEEEEGERIRLHSELSYMESFERSSLENEEFDFTPEEEENKVDGDIPFAKQAALMALARKYANLRKEVIFSFLNFEKKNNNNFF